MTNIVVASLRSFLIRGLAVVAVVFTYVIGNVGTQVMTAAGISALTLTTTATPASARRWRRWRRWRW